MVYRIDDFQVGPGFPLHEPESGFDLHGFESGTDGAAGISAQNACGSALPAQFPDHFGYVDAFSSGIGAHGGDAVDTVHGQGRDLHGFV